MDLLWCVLFCFFFLQPNWTRVVWKQCVSCRFLVECRYGKLGSMQQGLSSVGFLVKIPSSSLPSAVFGEGMYGVELRIAKGSLFMKCPKNRQELLDSNVLVTLLLYLFQQMKSIPATIPQTVCPCERSLAQKCILNWTCCLQLQRQQFMWDIV